MISEFGALKTGFAPEENETIFGEYPEVSFTLVEEKKGLGKLIITSKRVIWQSEDNGFTFPFSDICLHAISEEGIYCQLHSPEQKDLVEGAEIEEDEEDYQVNDIHFNPCDKQLKGVLFQKFCDGVSANPIEGSDDEAPNDMGLSAEGMSNLTRFEDMLDVKENDAFDAPDEE